MLTNLNTYSLGVSVSIVLTIFSIPLSYILSVHAQLIYTDEVVEVEISKGSSDANNTQFYTPPEAQVAAGSSIKWTNNDNVIHTVTQGKPSGDGNPAGFNSGPIQAGGTFEHFFDESGSVDYYCTIYPHMNGKVTVNPY